MCTNNENCVRFSGIFGSELIGGTYLAQIGLLIFLLLKNNIHKSKKFYEVFSNMLIMFLFIIIFLTGERMHFDFCYNYIPFISFK